MNEAAQNVVPSDREKLSAAIARRGIDDFVWKTLQNSIFPGAKDESILMACDWAKANGMDIMKKPCHIVPMSVKDAKTNEYVTRDVILPGIYAYRITAMRSGLYMGHSEPEYGEEMDFQGYIVPKYVHMVFRRWNQIAGQIVEFPVTAYFNEVVGLDRNNKINARWQKAPVQMLTKCGEAAGLREAFPDEVGGMQIDDELAGTTIEAHADAPAQIEHTRPSAATEALRAVASKVKPAAEKVAVQAEAKAEPQKQAQAEPGKGPSAAAALAKKTASRKVEPKKDPDDDSHIRTPEAMAKMIARLQSGTSIKAVEAQWASIKAEYHNDVPIDIEASYQEHLESLQQQGIG